MNFKRFSTSDNQWHDVPYYIHNTSTDTLTTLPAVLYLNDTTATVGLKGQMEQSSTPSPTTPIQPSECGERTGNLFDINATDSNNGYEDGRYLVNTGSSTASTPYFISEYIAVNSESIYTLVYSGSAKNSPSIAYYDNTKNLISAEKYDNTLPFVFTTPQNTAYIRFSGTKANVDIIMLNTGSSALPYEPYGQYKIPILSNSTTTNVYLGEVQSTRRIRKKIFDGSENWGEYRGGFIVDLAKSSERNSLLCTHYVPAETLGNNNTIYERSPSQIVVFDNRFESTDDFKAYLTTQFTNGTPVTIWYKLSTPETAVVNEPLRKIGTYADEVSGITIPTIAGANAIDVDTTLKPSEVSVNYHGWHPVQNVHERENGAWD